MQIPPTMTPMTSPIAGRLPMQVSKAYGVKQAAAVPAVQPPNQLVAGHVSGSVNFDAASHRVANSSVFQMYTRAADKVEAAVAVQIGRTLDVKG